jgi:hypothetical protein
MTTTPNTTTIEEAARMMNAAGAQFSAALALIAVCRAFDDAGLETFEDDFASLDLVADDEAQDDEEDDFASLFEVR